MRHTQLTHGQRRARWDGAVTDNTAARYSSRWGEYRAGRVVLVNPDLARAERDLLETTLRWRRLVPYELLLVVAVLVLATVAVISRVPLSAMERASVGVLALLGISTVWSWVRSRGRIPHEFRGHVLTGDPREDAPYTVGRRALRASAVTLGDLENTPGVTNEQVDETWRDLWDALTAETAADKERRDREEQKVKAERKREKQREIEEWAKTPVDPRLPGPRQVSGPAPVKGGAQGSPSSGQEGTR